MLRQYNIMKRSYQEAVIGIGTLAKRVGLSVSAIRKYEDEGLIIAHRTGSGHRMFSYEDIERIETIQHLLKQLGFNIEGIRRTQAFLPCWELLPCKESEKVSCEAFSNVSQPCWLIKGARSSSQSNKCRECDVYRFGSLCTEHVKELLHHKNEGVDSRKLMKDLLGKISMRH
jgi:MerR family transcriptional regulator/heat shock protein HspR